jgi:hypothetical protein
VPNPWEERLGRTTLRADIEGWQLETVQPGASYGSWSKISLERAMAIGELLGQRDAVVRVTQAMVAERYRRAEQMRRLHEGRTDYLAREREERCEGEALSADLRRLVRRA